MSAAGVHTNYGSMPPHLFDMISKRAPDLLKKCSHTPEEQAPAPTTPQQAVSSPDVSSQQVVSSPDVSSQQSAPFPDVSSQQSAPFSDVSSQQVSPFSGDILGDLVPLQTGEECLEEFWENLDGVPGGSFALGLGDPLDPNTQSLQTQLLQAQQHNSSLQSEINSLRDQAERARFLEGQLRKAKEERDGAIAECRRLEKDTLEKGKDNEILCKEFAGYKQSIRTTLDYQSRILKERNSEVTALRARVKELENKEAEAQSLAEELEKEEGDGNASMEMGELQLRVWETESDAAKLRSLVEELEKEKAEAQPLAAMDTGDDNARLEMVEMERRVRETESEAAELRTFAEELEMEKRELQLRAWETQSEADEALQKGASLQGKNARKTLETAHRAINTANELATRYKEKMENLERAREEAKCTVANASAKMREMQLRAESPSFKRKPASSKKQPRSRFVNKQKGESRSESNLSRFPERASVSQASKHHKKLMQQQQMDEMRQLHLALQLSKKETQKETRKGSGFRPREVVTVKGKREDVDYIIKNFRVCVGPCGMDPCSEGNEPELYFMGCTCAPVCRSCYGQMQRNSCTRNTCPKCKSWLDRKNVYDLGKLRNEKTLVRV